MRQRCGKLLLVVLALPILADRAATADEAVASPYYVAMSHNGLPSTEFETGVPGAETSTKENQVAIGLYRFGLGKATVDVGMDYQYTRYSYDNVPSRNRDLHRVQFPLSFRFRQSGWDIDGFLAPGVSTSSNVLRNPFDRLSSDDYLVTGRITGRKARDSASAWLLGLAYDRTFGAPRLYPVAGIEIAARDDLHVRLAFPDLSAVYLPGERHAYCLRVFPAGHQWHVLTDDLANDFDYRFEAIRSQFTWSYRFWRRVFLDVSLGFEFARHHRFEDGAANVIDADTADEFVFAVGLRAGSAPVLYTNGSHL